MCQVSSMYSKVFLSMDLDSVQNGEFPGKQFFAAPNREQERPSTSWTSWTSWTLTVAHYQHGGDAESI